MGFGGWFCSDVPVKVEILSEIPGRLLLKDDYPYCHAKYAALKLTVSPILVNHPALLRSISSLIQFQKMFSRENKRPLAR
jgi:hypothetical protein